VEYPKVVPSVGIGPLASAVDYVKTNPDSTWSRTSNKFPMESLVLRPTVDLRQRNGQRVIAKLKVKDFQ